MTESAIQRVGHHAGRPAWMYVLMACGGVVAFMVAALVLVSIVAAFTPSTFKDMPSDDRLALARMSSDAGGDRGVALARLESILPAVGKAYGESTNLVAIRAVGCASRLHAAGVMQDPVQMLEGLSTAAPAPLTAVNLDGAMRAYESSRLRGHGHAEAVAIVSTAMRLREFESTR